MLDRRKNRGELLPYLRNKNVRWGSFDTTDLARMRFEAHEHDRYGLKSGDLVVYEGGEPGRCAIWRDDVPGVKIQKALHRIRAKGQLDNRYLNYWFLMSARSGTLEPHFTGTTIKHLTGKSLNDLRLRLPPKPEQQAIAHILGTLDEKIELNSRMNETLEAMSRALFKSWFVDFDPVRAKVAGRVTGLPCAISGLFPGRLNANGLPDGWHRPQLGELLTVLETGRRPKGGVTNIMAGIPSVGAESIVKVGHFDFSKTKYVRREYYDSMSKGQVSDGDVLIYKDGGKPGELRPATTYVSGGFPFPRFCINEHVFRVRANAMSQPLLYMALSTDDAFWQMRELATGVAQPGLNQSAVRSLRITVPNDGALMRHAGALIDPLIDRCNRNSIEANRLAGVRDLLLPKLMSGELGVADAERIAAAAT